MAIGDYLFPAQPSYIAGLLGEDEALKAKQQAQTSGLLSMGLGIIAGSAPSSQRQGILQTVAPGIMAGQQAYQGAYDRQIQDQMMAAKFADMKRQMAIKDLLPSLYQETTDKEGNKTQTINKDVFQKIAFANPELAKQISEGQISARKAGLLPGMDTNAPSPFAPYLSSQNPQVRQLASLYEQGYKKGTIDEETAYKRIEPLSRMEEQFTARQIAAGDRAAKAAEGKKPTEMERLSSGFAQRMEFSEQQLNNIENLVNKQKAEGKNVGDPFATARTNALGSVPFAGEYLRNVGSSKQQQLYRNAQENWVRANLRKESGAVIGDPEMAKEIAVYFPQPGDAPETIAQKNLARQVTQDAMRRNAGVAYEPFNINRFKKDRGLE
jgi:hypothetical protein